MFDEIFTEEMRVEGVYFKIDWGFDADGDEQLVTACVLSDDSYTEDVSFLLKPSAIKEIERRIKGWADKVREEARYERAVASAGY